MNDTAGKMSSSLVVAEKRSHRPGGCAGVFFQLFNWNRKFAKKKLFSRKLLPPARAKQASKKFGGDEKMPMAKLLLIADENSGGFPSVKKSGICGVDDEKKLQKHEMRVPGLVARLMGLESMPTVQQEKPKILLSETHDDRDKKSFSKQTGSEKEDLTFEKGSAKNESRPQKIQKTGPFERRAVTRFGPEALQLKSVLSRSRKHHAKLASPMKSPRVISGKSASRLIDAATKILEPGLQAKNRAKCALTYSNYMHKNSNNGVRTERKPVLFQDLSKQPEDYVNAGAAQSLKGQSCKKCGNLIDNVNLEPGLEEQPSVYACSASSFVNGSSRVSGGSNPRASMFSVEQEQNVVFQKNHDQRTVLVAQVKDNAQGQNEPVTDRKSSSQEGQTAWHFSKQQCKLPKDVSSSRTLKCRTETQNQMLIGKDRMATRSKSSSLQNRRVSSAANINGDKDFVALNRSLSGRTRPRMPTKMDHSKLEIEEKSSSRLDSSLSQLRTQVRKRRPVNVGRQDVDTSITTTSYGNQRRIRLDVMSGKKMGLNATSVDSCAKSKLTHQENANMTHGKSTDVVSFAFSSPMRHKSGVLSSKEAVERKRSGSNAFGDNNSQKKNSTVDENDGHMHFVKQLPLRGDALGDLLEQKLKELTYQEEDEFGGNLPKRSTAMILQELISALTEEQLISGKEATVGIDQKDNLCCRIQEPSGHAAPHGHMINTDVVYKAEVKMEGTSVGYLHEGDHFSPGSVLDGSFSNDSFFSSSLDDGLGCRLHSNPMDYSYNRQPLEPDSELLDSATSLKKRATGTEMVTALVNRASGIIYCVNLAGARLNESKFNHAKEVILNAEILFGNAAPYNSEGIKDCVLGPFLLDKLENLAVATWTGSGCLGFEETKGGNQLRTFLFDSVIECLDSKYSRSCKSGFRAWRRLPLSMNTEMLIGEVDKELRRWTDFVGRLPDEIIEGDMSHSLGRWTDFEIEAFEIGANIDVDILQTLVDEIVMDLCRCKLGIS
ncbi:uncharacterized protein LOC131160217 [Malania oleifera]|uniref:uncharacterized protein LOC131160217 n=1 Tax=Malania oleifera TaxID=397392 RepID=UPI0025AE7BB4|nr:uncharacterized protein LOC131160217 [Malania oleifera]